MADRPNIVLIMTDQQRADFFASEDFPVDTMPFVEAMGAKGTRFARAYTPMPVCAPARTSLLTGRYPKATRVKQNWEMEKSVTFAKDLPSVLREQGYSVNLAGKNHSYLGRDDFDFYAPYSHTHGPAERASEGEKQSDDWLFKLDHHVSTVATPFPLENQLCYRIVSDAIDCVERNRDNPFFLWLSLPEPHNPYQAPEPYFSMFSPEDMPERAAGPQASMARGGKWQWLRTLQQDKRPGYDADWRRYRAVYAGMLRMIDDQIKRFVQHLEANATLDNTILIFLADHGDYAGDYGLQRKGVGLPECLIRVPFMVTGPGVKPSRNAEDFISLVDVMPTICEIVGAEIPFGCQGRSLWPILTGADYPAEEFSSVYSELGFGGLPYGPDERPPLHFGYEGPTFDELNSVTQSGSTKMVRKGSWKLIYDVMGNGELYDLGHDPGELDNLYDDPRYVAERTTMLEELLYWTICTEDPLPRAKYLPKVPAHNWYRAQSAATTARRRRVVET